MIGTEIEYQAAVRRLEEEAGRISQYLAEWRRSAISPEEVKRLIDPIQSFHDQLRDDVENYERLRRGEFSELHNLEGMGQLLVGLRIARGLTQQQLAERLGVSEAQVPKDERNEYHGVTVERANRILSALSVDLRSDVISTDDSPHSHAARISA